MELESRGHVLFCVTRGNISGTRIDTRFNLFQSVSSRTNTHYWCIVPLVKARSHRPKRKDYEWIAYNSRLLREFYAIAGFERFKTLLCVQVDVFLTRINVFLTKLTPFLTRSVRDSCSDCTSRSTTHNPSKSRKSRELYTIHT